MSVNEIEYSYLGVVTSGEIHVDNEDFGMLTDYKDRHEKALEELIESN
jgi:hypothetical protein